MAIRNALITANLAIFASAIALQLLVPSVSTYVFYGATAWFIVSLLLTFGWLRQSARPSSVGVGSGAAGLARVPPVPRTAPIDLGFCVYCAAFIEPGLSACPACGRAVGPF